MNRHHFIKRTLFLLAFALFTTRCSSDQKPIEPADREVLTYDYRGKVKTIELLGEYSVEQVTQLIGQLGLPEPVSTTTGLSLFRVQYFTRRYDAKEVLVSGLVGIPKTGTIKGIVSYQHGTNADRNNSLSKPTLEEGLPIAALFAGDGYMLLAPDYIGLGVSTETPPYLHTPSTVNAVVDLLTIGSVMLRNLTSERVNKLFLIGFSQGGHATAAVQRALEKQNSTGLKLEKSASVAGAFNLRDISIPYALTNQQSYYIGYVANAYSSVYGQPLNSLLTDEYARLIPGLFDGSVNVDQILSQLPTDPTTMLRPNVLAQIRTGGENWFTKALTENEAYRWKPVAPLRLYYGTNDRDVSPQDALSALTYMKGQGGNVEAVNLGELDHSQSAFAALPKIQAWFNQSR